MQHVAKIMFHINIELCQLITKLKSTKSAKQIEDVH